MAQGRLLDRVGYAVRAEVEDENIVGEKIKVRDTFPYNLDSKTAPETARRWAAQPRWDHKARKHIETTFDVVERDNSPFTVTIVDLDVRGRGGRAYKVVDSDDRRFDLREDQLLAILKHCGIMPGGRVPGNFVWGMLGSQMHMVLVGSELHAELEKETLERKALAERAAAGLTPQESNLQVGHVYRKRDKSLHLFVGTVRVPGNDKPLYALVQMPNKPSGWWSDEEITDERFGNQAPRYRAEQEIARRWDEMTWTQRCHWEWYEEPKFTYEMYKDQVPEGYYDRPGHIVLMTSPKFETDTGEVDHELATALRENLDSKHRYVTGHGDDVAERAYESETGAKRQVTFQWENWSTPYDVRRQREKEFHAKVEADIAAWRSLFKAKMVWS